MYRGSGDCASKRAECRPGSSIERHGCGKPNLRKTLKEFDKEEEEEESDHLQ